MTEKYAAESEGWSCAHATKEQLLETLAQNDFTTVVIRRESGPTRPGADPPPAAVPHRKVPGSSREQV